MRDLSGTNILVTGGAGLVGSHIVDELVREGAKITVYDNLIRGREEHLDWSRSNGNVTLIQADLRDRESLRAAVEGCEYVFHQAASWLRQCQREPRLSLDVNITGTFDLLEACVDFGIKKIVAASSSSVYGEGLYLPTDEDHPFNNDIFYGASKITNEQHYRCFYKQFGLNYVGLRYLNVYGPRQPYEAAYMDVIMNFLNRIDAGEPPQLRGDGSATVDLVFVADVAKANILAMKSDATDIFLNVASGRETTIKELALLLVKLAGMEGRLEPVFSPMDDGLVARRWGSPRKAREVIGFEAATPLADGLMRIIEWRRTRGRAGLPL
ncbi:MAG: SDR family NAD(P)-dependent oxidoreductase [Candidatus Omnitrophota bacterium]|nr:SDR family NAD(P)-dependent oxidoreductase [Candidatus Omnitrophota bacterium]